MTVWTDFISSVIIIAWITKTSIDINGSTAGTRTGITLRSAWTPAGFATVMARRTGLTGAIVIKSNDIAYTIVTTYYSMLRDITIIA